MRRAEIQAGRWRARLCVIWACWTCATLCFAQDRAWESTCDKGRGANRQGSSANKAAARSKRRAVSNDNRDTKPASEEAAQAKRRSRRAPRKAAREAREVKPSKPSPPAPADESANDALFERPAPPEPEPEPDTLSNAATEETVTAENAEGTEADETSECKDDGDAACTPALKATLVVNGGMTERRISVPTAAGLAALHTGLVPALGVELGAQWRDPDKFYAIAIAYQSSLRANATQPASDELKPPLFTGIHSHHLDAGGAAGLVLGSGPTSATLGFFLGYGLRAFGSVVELRVPRFTLHGPVARLEFQLPLGTPRVVVRLAPEAQLILSVTQDLQDLSGIAAPLFAFGGEASLRVLLTTRFILQLAFRESHAAVSSANGASFEDVERFVLFGVVVSYL